MSVAKSCILAAAMFLAMPAAHAAEVRIAPGDFIVLNPTNPGKGYSDIIVHAVGVATTAGEHLTLDSVRIDVMAGGQAVLTRTIAPSEMLDTTRFLASAPLPQFVSGQLLDARGLAGWFGPETRFARSATLEPSQALFAARLHFSIGFPADAVRATALLHDDKGVAVTASASVPVHAYKSPIAYRSPVDGQWMMQALPGVQSHHRFNPTTEFAVDFFKLGPDGHVVHGDTADARNFYGFGAPVRAAAAGTVASVISDQIQDRGAFLRKPGEAAGAFQARVGAYHMSTMAKNFAAANAGNMITIRHESGGAVEYSSYGHLKAGSVHVKPGDRVEQGQIIGEVGDTGDSAEVHLHFQINAGPDAFADKSLPAVFVNLSGVEGNTEPGLLVTTQKETP